MLTRFKDAYAFCSSCSSLRDLRKSIF